MLSIMTHLVMTQSARHHAAPDNNNVNMLTC